MVPRAHTNELAGEQPDGLTPEDAVPAVGGEQPAAQRAPLAPDAAAVVEGCRVRRMLGGGGCEVLLDIVRRWEGGDERARRAGWCSADDEEVDFVEPPAVADPAVEFVAVATERAGWVEGGR